MSEKEEKEKHPLTKEEYSVLLTMGCFFVGALLVFGFVVYKLVRYCLHAG